MSDAGRQILYIDMDNVLVDFRSGIERLSPEVQREYEGRLDEVPEIFELMDPMPGAIEAYHRLAAVYDTYILSTSPWRNPQAWQHKVEWVHRHLGEQESTPAYKRLILSHHKNLNHGDFLIDDRCANGVDSFKGEVLFFGPGKRYPTWESILERLLPDAEDEQ